MKSQWLRIPITGEFLMMLIYINALANMLGLSQGNSDADRLSICDNISTSLNACLRTEPETQTASANSKLAVKSNSLIQIISLAYGRLSECYRRGIATV
jgi:hypothetical protein